MNHPPHQRAELVGILRSKIGCFAGIVGEVVERVAGVDGLQVFVDHFPVALTPGGEEVALASTGMGVVVEEFVLVVGVGFAGEELGKDLAIYLVILRNRRTVEEFRSLNWGVFVGVSGDETPSGESAGEAVLPWILVL